MKAEVNLKALAVAKSRGRPPVPWRLCRRWESVCGLSVVDPGVAGTGALLLRVGPGASSVILVSRYE